MRVTEKLSERWKLGSDTFQNSPTDIADWVSLAEVRTASRLGSIEVPSQTMALNVAARYLEEAGYYIRDAEVTVRHRLRSLRPSVFTSSFRNPVAPIRQVFLAQSGQEITKFTRERSYWNGFFDALAVDGYFDVKYVVGVPRNAHIEPTARLAICYLFADFFSTRQATEKDFASTRTVPNFLIKSLLKQILP